MWVWISLPMSLLGFVWSYEDDELSLGQMLRIFIVYSFAGLIMALIGWYVAFAGIIRRRSERQRKSINP
jgi:hypothetical protein